MSMQCTCFRAWAANQVFCFLFLFLFSSFSFFFCWFISLPISIFLLLNFLTNIADSFGFKISKTHKKFHIGRLASNSTTQSSLYLWVLLPAARRDLCCVECIHALYLPFSIISLNDGEIVRRELIAAHHNGKADGCNGCLWASRLCRCQDRRTRSWCCSQLSYQTHLTHL